jgi:hypothetical protein
MWGSTATDVTSADVKHGFGIYDPHATLLGQVQAMPNRLLHALYDGESLPSTATLERV